MGTPHFRCQSFLLLVHLVGFSEFNSTDFTFAYREKPSACPRTRISGRISGGVRRGSTANYVRGASWKASRPSEGRGDLTRRAEAKSVTAQVTFGQLLGCGRGTPVRNACAISPGP